MRIALLPVLLLTVLPVRADGNLLDNGDFSRGVTHWEGDCHSLDNASDDMSSAPSSPGAGVVIKLRRDDWTKVTQRFTGKPGKYAITVKYALSAGYQFSDKSDDYTGVAAKADFGVIGPVDSKPDNWVIILSALVDKTTNSWNFAPNANETGQQTATATFKLVSNNDDAICLAFPPGDGVVTLQSVTILPRTDSTGP